MPRWWHRRRDLEDENARLRARITELEKQLTVLKAQQIIENLGIQAEPDTSPESPEIPAPKRTKRHLGVYDGASAVIIALLSSLAATVAAVRRSTARVALTSATATVATVALVIAFEGGHSHRNGSSIAQQPRTPASPETTQPQPQPGVIPPGSMASVSPVVATVAGIGNPVLVGVGTNPSEGSAVPVARNTPTPTRTAPTTAPTRTAPTVPPPADPPTTSTTVPVDNPPRPTCLTLNPLLKVCLPKILTNED